MTLSQHHWHPPPHFHAYYGEHKASVDVRTCIGGSLAWVLPQPDSSDPSMLYLQYRFPLSGGNNVIPSPITIHR
ncbi:DUF4160 domain-containing protein [Desulforhabdus sp. TSK]|uniref:DUF4160 domain-containing protein n=1 Tax=Desulforhabdus sp. TSK TaxID=2925014 RepID=UPI0034D54F12